jgi:hypothetical protein
MDDLLAGAIAHQRRVDGPADPLLEAPGDVGLRAAHGEREALARGDQRARHAPLSIALDRLEERRLPRLRGQRREMTGIDALLDPAQFARLLEETQHVAKAAFHAFTGM